MRQMNRETKKIKEIKVNDQSTWKQHVFLTFDTDWAKDFIIEDTINILLKYNLNATFFATGMSSLIKELLYSTSFEIGIHPNFNRFYSIKGVLTRQKTSSVL